MAPHIAAFFDLDNTIVPGPAIELEYFRLLWRHRMVGAKELLRSAAVLLRNIPPLSFDPLRQYKAYLVGKPASKIEGPSMAFFWENICPRISEDARRAIEEHRSQGHRLVLLTGCPEFLVSPLATFLKIEEVAAGRLERNGLTYTGRMLAPYPYREGKRIVAERLAAEQGLDLSASYMYGDSPGDLAALEAVGNPRVVNPIRGMDRIARRRGWRILHWQ
ncbi:MAG: HAD-IB family hydrolase [Nitrospirae bacterium]|nr:MAG: HAD-IB family hydrolase [Nitrospirota bacterium]